MPFPSLSRPRVLLLTGAWLGLALSSTARAEPAPAHERAVVPVEIGAAQALPARTGADPAPRIEIGSATQALWALQRSSISPHPRPIDGEQASRSYQRYLKSFETAIPERYGTGLELKQ